MDIPRSSYRPFYKTTLFWVVVAVEAGLLSIVAGVVYHFVAKYW